VGVSNKHNRCFYDGEKRLLCLGIGDCEGEIAISLALNQFNSWFSFNIGRN